MLEENTTIANKTTENLFFMRILPVGSLDYQNLGMFFYLTLLHLIFEIVIIT